MMVFAVFATNRRAGSGSLCIGEREEEKEIKAAVAAAAATARKSRRECYVIRKSRTRNAVIEALLLMIAAAQERECALAAAAAAAATKQQPREQLPEASSSATECYDYRLFPVDAATTTSHTATAACKARGAGLLSYDSASCELERGASRGTIGRDYWLARSGLVARRGLLLLSYPRTRSY